MDFDGGIDLEGTFMDVLKRTEEREDEVKRTVSGTGSLSLLKLKSLTANLCDREDDLKTTIVYMRNLVSVSLDKMEILKDIVEKNPTKEDTLTFINNLISEIRQLKEKTHGK